MRACAEILSRSHLVVMESDLHRNMKDRACRELANEGYRVFFEPLYAPSRFLRWEAYRPDLFASKAADGKQEYVLVECETRPSERKLYAKNFMSLEVQLRLDSMLSLRRILVVPRGKLARVDPSVRQNWEMWIYEGESLLRFPRASLSA